MSSVLPTDWPDSWEARPAWDVLISREEFGGEGDQLSLSVARGIRLRDESEGRAASDNTDHYRVVRRGDLVINRLVARDGAIDVSPLDGLISPAYWVMKTRRASDDVRFIAYQLQSAVYLTEIARVSKDMPPAQFDLPWDQFRKMPIVLPAPDEQRAIADFLDAETARIDALIAKKLRLTNLLKARRVSYLRKQLWPGSASPLLDAAGCVPLKRFVSRFVAGGTPDSENETYWSDDAESADVPWIAIGDLTDAGVTSLSARSVTVEGRAAARLEVGEPDTVLFAMYASLGKLSRLGTAATWNQAILGLVPGEGLEPEYLAFWLESIREDLELLGRSNTQANLNAQVVRELPIRPLGLEEQRRLVAALRNELDRDVHTRRLLDRQQELLRERRQALITAAVTGHLGVSGAAA